jgi:hypothetical protein
MSMYAMKKDIYFHILKGNLQKTRWRRFEGAWKNMID